MRDAVAEDVDALVRLWREAGPGGSEAAARIEDEAPLGLAHVLASADERLVVVEEDGQVVAALHLRRAPISPLHLEQVVHTSYLLVLPEHRRHGHARLLLETALAWAEEKGLDHVTAASASSSRDANRFLARLGFGTVAHLRITSTGSLRKRLSPVSRTGGPARSIGEVLAARRSMRRREEGASDA
ncbi:MAG: GNAT family N-acetyltransferase [Marmoricola sp.]